MKRLILTTALSIWALTGALYAQELSNARASQTMTERVFDIYPGQIRYIHTVFFSEKIKMIIKLENLKDYGKLIDIDSIIALMQSDIAFYKDSIDAGSGLRIDYAYPIGGDDRRLRFKKYPADGDMFIVRNNEISRLKIEPDTVSIFIYEPLEKYYKDKKGQEFMHLRSIRHNGLLEPLSPVQIIFCMNSYTDLDTFLPNKPLLNNIFDTLYHYAKSDSIPQYLSFKDSSTYFMSDTKYFSNSSDNRYTNMPYLTNTIDYTLPAHFLIKHINQDLKTSPITLAPEESKKTGLVIANQRYYDEALEDKFKKSNMLLVDGNVGLGLVRNTIAPSFDLGIEYNRIDKYDPKHVMFFRISTTPYYFFDKDSHGNFIVNDNWFVNANIGSIYNKKKLFIDREDIYSAEIEDFGIGYLVLEKGGYFKNTTMKVFTDIKMGRFTISPELIATNNFMQFFPGLRVSVF